METGGCHKEERSLIWTFGASSWRLEYGRGAQGKERAQEGRKTCVGGGNGGGRERGARERRKRCGRNAMANATYESKMENHGEGIPTEKNR